MKKMYSKSRREKVEHSIQVFLRKLALIGILICCALLLRAQTNFGGLGAENSGGTGFKTMANNANLVVSNIMTNDGIEMYTGSQGVSFKINTQKS